MQGAVAISRISHVRGAWHFYSMKMITVLGAVGMLFIVGCASETSDDEDEAPPPPVVHEAQASKPTVFWEWIEHSVKEEPRPQGLASIPLGAK